MQSRISMVSLGVRDLAASTAFYSEGLGLPMMDSPPGVAFFKLNGTWLGLTEREALAADAGVAADGDGFSGVALAHNVASEGEVDRVMAEAREADARIVKAASKADWGGYHGYFADPDGHLWEVAFNPFLWIGPKED